MTNQDLKKLTKKVRTLRDQGLSFEKIAMALNEKGFTNLEGEAWKRGAVERFYKRRVQNTAETRPQATGRVKAPPAKKAKEDVGGLEPVSHSDGLDQVVTDFKDLLEWWRIHKEATELQPSSEPVKLAGPKKGATISINQYVFNLAQEKALLSGGRNVAALSGLVEHLLWRHLGCPTHDDKGTPLVLQVKSKKAAKE